MDINKIKSNKQLLNTNNIQRILANSKCKDLHRQIRQLIILLSGNHHVVYYLNLNQKNSQAINYLLLLRRIRMEHLLYSIRSTFIKRQAPLLTIYQYIFTNYMERRYYIFLIYTTGIWQKMLPGLMSNYIIRIIWSCIML